MLPPPIGYVHLYQAVDAVGRAAHGTEWRPICCQDWLKYLVDTNLVGDVIEIVAEGCEAGKLAATYPTVHGGVDDLDRSEWRKTRWRNYFFFGTIDLDLPLVDASGRPNQFGRTARCTRKIFIRKDSLDEFIKSRAPTQDFKPAKRYPGDVALIEEGRRMMAKGMQKRAVARALATRAEGGGTLDSKIDRLRKAL
jgi:hypothetical protein